jgi:excisionase family DNA binding protein
VNAKQHKTQSRRDLLTTKEFATLAGVSAQTVHNWKNAGLLAFHRIGPKLIRFHRADVDLFLSAREFRIPDADPDVEVRVGDAGEVVAVEVEER